MTYGEPATGNQLTLLASWLKGIHISGPKADAHIHALRAQGYRPMLQVVHDFRFNCEVLAENVLPIVRTSRVIQQAQARFNCWLLLPHDYILVLGYLLQSLPGKRHLQRGEGGAEYAFTVKPGQLLATLTTAHEPLPHVMIA
ncbi:MAG: hypothetical protein WA001_00220 [Patescibacteria group bacterium]